MRTRQLGELKAYVTGGNDGQGGGDGPVVVLLHGFGAPGFDLVDLGSMLDVPDEVRFVFPEAPLALDAGPGRAWWMLDMALFEARARGERVDRSGDVPESLDARCRQLSGLLDAVQKELKVGMDRVVLGGFSQGSMLACDYALQAAHKPAGLMLLSSTLIALPRWQPGFASLAGVKVFQSHGQRDPILPFDDAERLRTLLTDASAAVQFTQFPGGHELPPIVLRNASQFLRDVLYPSP